MPTVADLLHEDDTFPREGSRASNWSRPTAGQHSAGSQAEQDVERSPKSSTWGRFLGKLACFHPSTLEDDPGMQHFADFEVDASSHSIMVRQLQRDQSCTMSSYLATAPSSLSKTRSKVRRSKNSRTSSTADAYGYPEMQPKSDIFL